MDHFIDIFVICEFYRNAMLAWEAKIKTLEMDTEYDVGYKIEKRKK